MRLSRSSNFGADHPKRWIEGRYGRATSGQTGVLYRLPAPLFVYILVMIVGALISGAAALWVRSSYSKYSKQPSASGLTRAQTARTILNRNGLTNVRLEPVAGTLTDHYYPMRKVVRLSEGTFRNS